MNYRGIGNWIFFIALTLAGCFALAWKIANVQMETAEWDRHFKNCEYKARQYSGYWSNLSKENLVYQVRVPKGIFKRQVF